MSYRSRLISRIYSSDQLYQSRSARVTKSQQICQEKDGRLTHYNLKLYFNTQGEQCGRAIGVVPPKRFRLTFNNVWTQI